MKNKIREANIYMIISKTFSGLNMNALKYLLPLWISPLTGVTLRCTFAALAFWIIGLHPTGDFHPPGKDSLIPVGGARHLWLYVLLLAGIEQNDPCIKLHFLQFTTYLGIHSFCHFL